MLNVNDKVYLKQWIDEGDKIKFVYEDGDSFYVSRVDFNRAFGCLVSGAKDEIKYGYAINLF